MEIVTDFFAVLQQLSPLLQGFVFSRGEFRLFNLLNLVAKHLHFPQLLPFVHCQAGNLPLKLGIGFIFFPILPPQRFIAREVVQKNQMVVFVKQGSRIVLSVNIDQLHTQLPQNGNRNQGTVYPAYVFAVQVNLPLDYGFRVVLHPVFLKPGKLRHLGEYTPDGSFGASCTNHIPVSPLSHNGRNGVNDNGFTRTGLTGEDIKPLVKGNVGALDHRDIFNMQKT